MRVCVCVCLQTWGDEDVVVLLDEMDGKLKEGIQVRVMICALATLT